MSSFPHAIIAPQKCIHFLEGVGELFYRHNSGILYPEAEPESFPNSTYNQDWIQSMWSRCEHLGYHLLAGDTMPYYSLFDEEKKHLFIYQKVLLEMGYTPLSFEATQELITDQSIFFFDPQCVPSL